MENKLLFWFVTAKPAIVLHAPHLAKAMASARGFRSLASQSYRRPTCTGKRLRLPSPLSSTTDTRPICTRREYVRPTPLPDGPLTATPARRLIAASSLPGSGRTCPHTYVGRSRHTTPGPPRQGVLPRLLRTCPDHSPPDHSPHQPRSRRYPGRGAASSRASSGFARRRRRRRSRSTASFARRCRCSAARLALTWASS